MPLFGISWKRKIAPSRIFITNSFSSSYHWGHASEQIRSLHSMLLQTPPIPTTCVCWVGWGSAPVNPLTGCPVQQLQLYFHRSWGGPYLVWTVLFLLYPISIWFCIPYYCWGSIGLALADLTEYKITTWYPRNKKKRWRHYFLCRTQLYMWIIEMLTTKITCKYIM